jgi:hypothetical protein
MKFTYDIKLPVLLLVIGALFFIAAFDGNRSYNPPAAQNVMSRAYNTGFRPNQQRDCIVGYTVTITTSATVLNGTTGEVILQVSNDSTTWSTLMSAQQGFSNGVTIPASTGSITLFGLIKAKQWCRLITNNIAGTPTYSTPTGTELSF